MTDNYTALGELVTESRQLLDLIKGGAIATMQSEHTQAVKKFESDATTFLGNLKKVVPTIALTKNQAMEIVSGGVPDSFLIREGVSMNLLATIKGDVNARTAEQLQLLTDIETGLKEAYPDFDIRKAEYYFRDFNVFRVSWDFGDSFKDYDWLFFSQYCGANRVSNFQYPRMGVTSDAALIKLESGTIGDAFSIGVEQGKWRFTHRQRDEIAFAGYVHPHPLAHSKTGSLLVALPVSATGYLDHPHKLFALPEFN